MTCVSSYTFQLKKDSCVTETTSADGVYLDSDPFSILVDNTMSIVKHEFCLEVKNSDDDTVFA